MARGAVRTAVARGRLSIGYDEDRDQFLLEIEEFQPELEERRPRLGSCTRGPRVAPAVGHPRADARALATRRRRWSTAAGPTCQFCGNPMDPEGHACPAMNGHSKPDLTTPPVPPALASGELELLGAAAELLQLHVPARAATAATTAPRRLQTAPRRDAAVGLPRGHALPARGRGVRGRARARLAARPADGAARRARGRSAPCSCSSSSIRPQHYFTLEETHADAFRRVALFDLVVNNADRKGGHCLLATDGDDLGDRPRRLLRGEPKLRTVIWEFAGEPIPPDAVADLERVRAELETGGAVADALGALLAPDESAAIARADRATPHVGALPRARARRPPIPMAADLTLRHAQVPTPFGRSPSWSRRTAWSRRAARIRASSWTSSRDGSGWCPGRRRSAPPPARSRPTSAAGVRRCARRSTSASWARRSRGGARGHVHDPVRGAVDLRRRRRPGGRPGAAGGGVGARPTPDRAVRPLPSGRARRTRARRLRRIRGPRATLLRFEGAI